MAGVEVPAMATVPFALSSSSPSTCGTIFKNGLKIKIACARFSPRKDNGITMSAAINLPEMGSMEEGKRLGAIGKAGTGLNASAAKDRKASFEASSTAAAAVAPLSNLFEFICQGPLLTKAGINASSVLEGIDEWLSLGLRLSTLLGFTGAFLSDPENVRIYHYYLPLYFWCKKELEAHRDRFKEGEPVPPLIVGISAPQGCGKTTLVDALEFLFVSNGRQATSISIDDFYLTASEQTKLAAENPGNKLLEFRGNAGTHDLKLGIETLRSLQGLTSSGAKLKIPHYDKSANSGRGDRAATSTWPEVHGPLEIVLFEGWMLGFKPVGDSIAKSLDAQLQVVNKNLASYDVWHNFVDSWIVIQIGDPSWVFKWRLEAEIQMKAEGKPGMSDEQVADFVSRYMPAYKAYLPSLYNQGPGNGKPDHTFQFQIDQNRSPVQ